MGCWWKRGSRQRWETQADLEHTICRRAAQPGNLSHHVFPLDSTGVCPKKLFKADQSRRSVKSSLFGKTQEHCFFPSPIFILYGLVLNFQLFIASATKIHIKVYFSCLVFTTIRNLKKLTLFGKHNSGISVNARDFFFPPNY